ncbi:DoxX family protein [Streptomyces sp. CA-210063]|uniref:DoxX family protein n=1 Tax=Streptomyces sp. CA-210063 TaxID=2801029 RepID=UPI0027D4622C|nr:DoxX family protein [Streptomyces sp. CA-210063]
MNLGLLLLRLLLAALLFGHGTQKLFGWFGGAGLAGTAAVFDRWGFVPARRMVLVAAAAELGPVSPVFAGARRLARHLAARPHHPSTSSTRAMRPHADAPHQTPRADPRRSGRQDLTGVASVAAGLLTPGGCAVAVGTMTVAAVATAPNGFWAQQGGCEAPFWYGAVAAVLAFTGPGTWSLDHALGLTQLGGHAWGFAASAVGLAAAAVPLIARSRVLSARTTPASTTR